MRVKILYITFLAICMVSFQEKNEIRLAEDIVAEKIRDYKAKRYKGCREELWNKAGEVADSLLLYQAKKAQNAQDSFPFPVPKPPMPEEKPLPDSLILGPLWKVDSLPDSLKEQ